MSDQQSNHLCAKCNEMFDWSKYGSTFLRMRKHTIERLEASILRGEGDNGEKENALRDMIRRLKEELLQYTVQQQQFEGVRVPDMYLWSGHTWGDENDGEYKLELGSQRRDWVVGGYCRLCKLLWSITDQGKHGECKDLDVYMCAILNWISLLPIQLEFEVEIQREFSFRTVVMRSRIEDTPLTSTCPPQNSDSPETWAMLSNLLADCVDNHSRCREDHDPHWLPTRLIDVGNEEPRLIMTAELSLTELAQMPRYLALSHIWGNSAFTRLVSSNTEQLKQCIPFTGLSQTFRDAISVAQRSGVRYIWIDSLCIKQDSVEDWRTESSTMGLVYKNSLFTIAASEAVAPEQGLFKKRDTEIFTPFDVHLVLGPQQRHNSFCFYDYWNEVREKSPLSRRGWATQERLLSSRTIHFATPVFWECRETVACETYPAGLTKGRNSKSDKIWTSMPTLSKEDTLDGWEGSVETYSQGHLTKVEDDKLVAVSGIAKTFGDILQDEYLAGLWRRSLVRGLIWGIEKNHAGLDIDGTRRSTRYRAPTWSWASIDGKIDQLSQKIEEPLIAILHAQTAPVSQDPFGQVSSGYIELRGRVFVFRATATRMNLLDARGFLPDEISADDMQARLKVYYYAGPNTSSEALYFLPIARITPATKGGSPIHGLLLEREGMDGDIPTFTRIGYAQVSGTGNIAQTVHQVLGWVSPPWNALHTIRIV